MATVQEQLLSFTHIVDPRTKKYQVISGVAAALAISGATNATPIEITTVPDHFLKTGDQVHVKDVSGNTAANNTLANPNWTITDHISDPKKFTLDGSVGNGAFVADSPTVTPALIGTVNGEKFQKERLIEMYNQARLLAFGVLKETREGDELSKRIGGVLIEDPAFTFLAGVATLPVGWVKSSDLFDVSKVQILIEETALMAVVRGGKNSNYVETATNRFVFRIGNTLKSESGNTFIPDLSTYVFRYYGLPSFTLTDVIGNTTLEGFDGEDLQRLLEVGQAIAKEQGTAEINSVTKILFGGQ